MSALDQHLVVVDYKFTDYGPKVACSMPDATQISPAKHHDEKHENTMLGENKEHEKSITHCSQSILLDNFIELIDGVWSHGSSQHLLK